MSFMRFAYSLLWYAATPLLLLRLLWRARRQPEYLRHVTERFGVYRGAADAVPLIWVHAVSVGETRAAAPLVRALQARHPRHRILLTHMTPTGRDTGAALFGDSVLQCYLPYDQPCAVARFLDRFRPVAGVLIETEIWPNLIHAAAARDIPLYLVNARLSVRSQAGYRRSGALARDALRALTGITAQTGEDAARLRELGAPAVTVTGNLKFDIEVPTYQTAAGRELRAGLGARPVLVAASTRDGEEALLLDAVRREGLGDALLIIVPRHPQRGPQVAQALAPLFRVARRAAGEVPAPDTELYIADTLGELGIFYRLAPLAVIGGSFVPHGGQNPLEPARLGVAVLSGPHIGNFRDIYRILVEAGGAEVLASNDLLTQKTGELLSNELELSRRGQAAGKAAGTKQPLVRTMELLAPYLRSLDATADA